MDQLSKVLALLQRQRSVAHDSAMRHAFDRTIASLTTADAERKPLTACRDNYAKKLSQLRSSLLQLIDQLLTVDRALSRSIQTSTESAMPQKAVIDSEQDMSGEFPNIFDSSADAEVDRDILKSYVSICSSLKETLALGIAQQKLGALIDETLKYKVLATENSRQRQEWLRRAKGTAPDLIGLIPLLGSSVSLLNILKTLASDTEVAALKLASARLDDLERLVASLEAWQVAATSYRALIAGQLPLLDAYTYQLSECNTAVKSWSHDG